MDSPGTYHALNRVKKCNHCDLVVIEQDRSIASTISHHFNVISLSHEVDLDQIKSLHPKVILVGVDSGSKGIERCRQLKQDSGTNKTPIIACFSKNCYDLQMAAFNAGVNDVEILSSTDSCIRSRIDRFLRNDMIGIPKISSSERSRTSWLRDAFPEACVSQSVQELFEKADNCDLFIQDLQGRYLYGNRQFLGSIGVSDRDELIGTTAHDYFPAGIAESVNSCDHLLKKATDPFCDAIHLRSTGSGVLTWVLTTKTAVIDLNQNVLGLVGITRSLMDRSKIPSRVKRTEIYRLLKEFEGQTDKRSTTEEMAKMAGLSLYRLRRQFNEVLGMKVQEFELSMRIQAASRALLQTDKTISEIAINFGFYDQSAFSNQFKIKVGFSPSEFRKRDGKLTVR